MPRKAKPITASLSKVTGSDPGTPAGRLRRIRRPLTTAEQIADAVGAMIVDGTLVPHERIGEEKLADLYHVSRGPVRDAFRVLEKRRLVEIIPRRGAFVRPVTRDSIADLFNVRNTLAGMAAAHVARRVTESPEANVMLKLDRRLEQLRGMAAKKTCQPLDYSFQMTRIVYTIIVTSRNQLLQDIWAELNDHTFWSAIWKKPQDAFTVAERQERLAQVEATVMAIRNGDPDAAERNTRIWLNLIRDRVLSNLEVIPGALAGGEQA
ncbi:GntR family transcriptional regulator [Chachezhania sediminis]|uniref:GntR family transcriptional regulator n=1 Tax=Chachezhania sediminis TaxID=2599291 RepID=UPI00131DA085|nr:GntR family transcriptional regulator [Chachezhania sediminis]